MVNLKDIPTKKLLYYLDHARACGGSYDITDNHNTNTMINIDELKIELATREHIPNKKEAKIIRQNKARGNN